MEILIHPTQASKKKQVKKEQRTRSCLSHFITISVFGLIRILLVANIALIDVENISKYGEKKDYLLIASSAFLHYHTFLICTKDN